MTIKSIEITGVAALWILAVPNLIGQQPGPVPTEVMPVASLGSLLATLPPAAVPPPPPTSAPRPAPAPAATVFSPVNSKLPPWMRISGEFRNRDEGRTSFGFKSGDDDAYALTRLRLNADFSPSPWFHAFVQGQDSHALGMNPAHLSTSYKDAFDLRQAYVQLRNGEKGWFSLTIGRQELKLGEERLVGASDWGNVSRSFNAVRLGLESDGHGARLDVIAASVVNIYPTSFDHPLPGQNLYGAYSSFTKFVPQSTVQPYFLWKTNPLVVSKSAINGDSDIYTFGIRWTGLLLHGFDYDFEMARQMGHYSTNPVAAWAGSWIGGYTFSSILMKPHVSVEYDYASGDKGQSENQYGTFDQLYPTNHSFYGIVDQVGWRNTRVLRAGTDFQPRPKMKAGIDYLDYELASRHDGLYNDAGSLIVKAPATGALSADVGREVDLYVKYEVSRAITLGSGIGHLFPGAFLKQNSKGEGMTYPYFMCTYKF